MATSCKVVLRVELGGWSVSLCVDVEVCAVRLGSRKYAAGGNRAMVSMALRARRVWLWMRCTLLW